MAERPGGICTNCGLSGHPPNECAFEKHNKQYGKQFMERDPAANAAHISTWSTTENKDIIDQETVLEEAARVVDGPRQDNYGHPKVNLKRIADLWSVVFNQTVTPQQVALCLIQLKVAREIHHPRRDNMVDIAGYARVMEMLSE